MVESVEKEELEREKKGKDFTSESGNEYFPNLLHPRYKWIDQYRGMVIMILFIASFTWIFSSKMWLGEVPPIGPTWLNHGWRYYDGTAPIITVVDIGAAIFMFILGISMTISFRSKRAQKGGIYAWSRVLMRFLALIWLGETSLLTFSTGFVGIFGLVVFLSASAICAYFGLVVYRNSDNKIKFGVIWAILAVFSWFLMGLNAGITVWDALFGNILAYLGWGSLAAALFVNLIDEPDRRILVVPVLFVLHFLLYLFDQGTWVVSSPGSITNNFQVPYDVLGNIAVAVSATCVWDWMNMDPTDQKVGIKKRVIPIGILFFIIAFMWDFIVPANHFGVNDALASLAIGSSTLLAVVYWDFEHTHRLKIPILSELGRNAILFYMLQALFVLPYRKYFTAQILWSYGWPLGPLIGLGLVLAPLIGFSLLALFLNKKRIFLKF